MTAFNPSFYGKNLITSTSLLTVSSGTSTNNKFRLIDRNVNSKFVTSSETSGSRTITITFASATGFDILACQGINWEDFTVTLDGADTIATVTGYTGTNWCIAGAESCTTMVIEITKAQSEPAEAQCGQLTIADLLFTMSDTGSGKATDARYGVEVLSKPSQWLFDLSDGTTQKIFINEAFEYSLGLENITEAERTNFLTTYNYNKQNPLFFVPWGNSDSASWDGNAQHVNWVNGFDFYNRTNDLNVNGFDGYVNLRSTGGIG